MIARITESLSMTVFHETISILSENQEVNNYRKMYNKECSKGHFRCQKSANGCTR